MRILVKFGPKNHTSMEVCMRYLISVAIMTMSVSAAAADGRPNQTWTENNRSGTTDKMIAQETSPNDATNPTERNKWTQEYQYGKNDMPKTGKPEEGGEFEVAPRK
jgi:hypothetical protein